MSESVSERHQREKDELEAKIKDLLSTANTKNERKRLNKQAEQMRRDLFDKQMAETEDDYMKSLLADVDLNEPVESSKAAEEKPKKSKEDVEKNRQKRMKKMQKKYQM